MKALLLLLLPLLLSAQSRMPQVWMGTSLPGSCTSDTIFLITADPITPYMCNSGVWTRISPMLAGSTASIGGGILLLGACASGNVTVTGADTTMTATATPATYPGDGMNWKAYVSSANTVTVKVCAGVAGTPTASVYHVRVLL